jgi:GR25 family glycosyltransferase involved in LPS biosynthesis
MTTARLNDVTVSDPVSQNDSLVFYMKYAPTFVINLDRSPDRLVSALARLEERGFTNVTRWPGVDGKLANLAAEWSSLQIELPEEYRGTTKLSGRGFKLTQQGCALSHYKLWQHMIDNGIPVINVFKNDVGFHSEFDRLAPIYLDETPLDYDIMYMGQFLLGRTPNNKIVTQPCYCTHAYSITLSGAKKLWRQFHMLRCGEMYSIDAMIMDLMLGKRLQIEKHNRLVYYAWNATMYPEKKMKKYNERAMGLVYQDGDAFRSLIDCP